MRSTHLKEWRSSDERWIATAEVEGVVVRLCEPSQGEFPSGELSGRENKHQVGFWTSDTYRPKGIFRYGNTGKFAPLRRVAYVPAEVRWTACVMESVRVKPSLFCDFDKSFFREIAGIEAEDSPQHLKACLSVTSPAMQQALWLMHEEVKHPGFAHAITVDALSRMILVEVGRYFRHFSNPHSRPHPGKLAPWQIDRLRSFIEEVEGQAITVSEIADLCGVSASHFRRMFRATIGMPISSYIESVRIERAKSMLLDRKIPLKQIAFRLGFSNPSTFSTAFRRATHTTPMTYRQIASD
jgi:AraC family transcriptional regulator